MPPRSTCFMLLFLLYRSALTATPLSLSSLTVFKVTVPFKNNPINPSLTVRPHDPLEMNSDWDGPGFISLTFSHYGAEDPLQLALYCISLALKDAQIDHGNVWNQAIGKSELLYTHMDSVILGVLPRAAMTWNMFYYAMLLVHQFTRDFESMAFDFEVEVTGVQGLAATGNLTIIPEFDSSL